MLSSEPMTYEWPAHWGMVTETIKKTRIAIAVAIICNEIRNNKMKVYITYAIDVCSIMGVDKIFLTRKQAEDHLQDQRKDVEDSGNDFNEWLDHMIHEQEVEQEEPSTSCATHNPNVVTKTEPTERNIGQNTHRLRSNPLEAQYAKAWKDKQDRNMLGWLMNSPNDNYPVYTSERDELIAATVIQWLGSPIGQNFIYTVMQNYD